MARYFSTRALLIVIIALALAPAVSRPSLAQCAANGNNQTCTNNDSVDRVGVAVQDTGTLTITNNGRLVGTQGGTSSLNIILDNAGLLGGATFAINTSGTINVNNRGEITSSLTTILGGGATNIVNSGSINSTSPAGLAIGALGAVTVQNSGVISGGAGNGAISTASSAVIMNTGVITGGFGINITNGPSHVINAGLIRGSTFALISGGGNLTLTLLPGSQIVGRVLINGANNVVEARGGNSVVNFTSLAGVAVRGNAVAAGNTVVAYDPTVYGQTARALNDVTGAVSGALGSRSAANIGGNAGASEALGYAAAKPKRGKGKDIPWPVRAQAVEGEQLFVWAQGFGGLRDQPAKDDVARSQHGFWGGMAGVDRTTPFGLRYGFYAGGASGRLDVESNIARVDSNYGFLGIYGGMAWQRLFVDAALTAGGSQNDSRRTVLAATTETATASYKGWLLSPEVTLGYRLPVMEDLTLVPSAKTRFTAGWFDGYTEQGSVANLTVGDRKVQAIESRAQLAAISRLPSAIQPVRLTLRGGVVHFAKIGDDNVNAVVLGQTFGFTGSGPKSTWGGFGGAGFEVGVRRNVSLFGEGELLVMDDSSRNVTGRAGLRATF